MSLLSTNEALGIPFGAKRVLGQSQPGDRYFDSTTKRWKKLRPRWPVIGEDEIIIRRADVTQLAIPGTEDQPTEIDEMEIPEIYVLEDEEAGFVLMARSYGSNAPAGERLFRKEPWPAVKFVHADRFGAENDAAKLREYLASVHPKNRAQAKRESGK